MITTYYVGTFLAALALSAALTPAARSFALRWGILDWPNTAVKTHAHPTPYLGGAAIFVSILIVLAALRFVTHFPTGTLRALRGLLVGAGFMFAVGLVDDLKPGGLDFRWKFLFQFVGALILIAFDVRIRFVHPEWVSYALTVLWVVGVTNAFNLIDIMDGLSSSQAFVASLGFLFISLPTEDLYVNFAAAATAGACLGFLPYNLSKSRKIFMGDAGSLMIGFLMAALAMGTSYTRVNEIGVFAPLIILGLPLYDTAFVSILRIAQGKNPFLGSKDHLALKLRFLGLSSRQVVALMALAASAVSVVAYLVTWLPMHASVFVFGAMCYAGLYVILRLQKVSVE